MLIFGPQAVSVGQRELTIAHDHDTLIASELLQLISDHYPALAPTIPSTRLAVNHEFIEATDPLQCQDEIALIGMISGG